MSSEEDMLNGVTPPQSNHTWVSGLDLVELDSTIKQLRRKKRSVAEIADELQLSRPRVAHRIHQMIIRGEIRGKHPGAVQNRHGSVTE